MFRGLRTLAVISVIVFCNVGIANAGFTWGGGQNLGTFEESFIDDIDSEASDVEFKTIKAGVVNAGEKGFLLGLGKYLKGAIGYYWDRQGSDDLPVYIKSSEDLDPDEGVGKLLSRGEYTESGYFKFPMIGDVNKDGVVDMQDAVIVSAGGGDSVAGDVNKDGKKDIYDSSMIARSVVGLFELDKVVGLMIGDLNKDGVVNASDAAMISEYNSGYRVFSELDKVVADVNGDFFINYCDIQITIAGMISMDCSGNPVGMKGDVNKDGVVDIKDLHMLGQGVSGDRILTAEQGVFADVDNSSSVDMCDVKVLTKMISGIGGVDCSFPDYNSQFSVGDINRDGKVDVSDAAIILQKSISGYSFSDREIYFHDVNKDGIVNVYDSNVIIKNNFGLLELNRISGYRIGDVDRNGKVSVVDSNIVAEYVSGYRDLTELEKALADVNGDGAVGPCDSDIIVKMALRIVTDEKASFVMCNDSLGDVLGDVDGNGSVGVEDVVLFAKDASKGEDVNGDGAVDSCDVTAISELIAGKIGIRGVKNKECVN